MKRFWLLLLGTTLAVPPAESPAQSQELLIPAVPFNPRSYVCYRTIGPVTVDGRMDEPAWTNAPWTEDFRDIEGPSKQTPRFRTHAKMLWDDDCLYIAAELEDTDIWATLTERDAVIYHDNDFEVFIDPDGDTHQYYELEMNALNTVWDLFLVKPYRDGGPYMNGWDIHGLRTAVAVDGTVNKPGDRDLKWTVELALPWKALVECAHRSSPPKGGDQWRMNFSRVEYKVKAAGGGYEKLTDAATGKPLPEDNWLWTPQGLINVHYPEMWGFVQFSEKVAGSGEDPFVFLPEENAKWALRQIYYKERNYFAKNHAFVDDLATLGLTGLSVKGYAAPVIGHTTDCFEATIARPDGGERWHIVRDGRTWKE